MKFITAIFTTLLLSFSLQAAIGTPADLTLIATGPKEMVLKMEAPLRTATHLEIIDADGAVLYSDRMKANTTVAKQFMLEQFKEGQYELVLTDELFETTYTFQVTATGIQINTSDVTQVSMPVVTVKGSIANLNFMNKDKVAVKVDIIDRSGETVYTENIPAKGVVMRTYNLSELKENDYRMVVTAGQKSITKYLAL